MTRETSLLMEDEKYGPVLVTKDGKRGYLESGNEYVYYVPGYDNITLDGSFDIKTLEAIVRHMKAYKDQER